jgi:PiT family inorganic phosphate transporter
MASPATLTPTATTSILDEKLKRSSPGKAGMIAFGVMLLGGLGYITSQLWGDLSVVHNPTIFPYILLGVALLIALGFEFVNGFHDTANAVATVIYTHSLEPHIAVVYSGILNFTGAKALVSPWYSRFWWRRSCGTWRRGTGVCRRRARTP